MCSEEAVARITTAWKEQYEDRDVKLELACLPLEACGITSLLTLTLTLLTLTLLTLTLLTLTLLTLTLLTLTLLTLTLILTLRPPTPGICASNSLSMARHITYYGDSSDDWGLR